MLRSRSSLLALPALAIALVIAGCDSGVTAPEAVVFDEDAELFLAEAGVSSAASPAARVGAAVRHAHQVLDRARAFVGDTPSSDVAARLAQAERACATASEALTAERWRLAVTASMRCVHAARQTVLLAQAERHPDLEARAAEAHAAASALVDRASELVTPDAPPMAKRVLASARTHLAEAQEALDRGQFRLAVARAALAGALAQRILKAQG